ncbi:MAG: ParB N-terminal domain-containing protein [Gemmataceae bacterium]|nr:ParB N-terminal domain-containing protein [Gemmataceae bacterium]
MTATKTKTPAKPKTLPVPKADPKPKGTAKPPKDGAKVVAEAMGKDPSANGVHPPAALPPAPAPQHDFGPAAGETARKRLEWATQNVPVADIVVEGRYRSNDGDLAALARSIGRFGLLVPIGVEAGTNRLIHGGRRLAACKLLGLTEVKAVLIDLGTAQGRDREAELLRMEVEENEQRVNPTWSDSVRRAEQIEALYKTKKLDLPKGVPLREKVAQAANMSHESLRQSRVVLAAIEKNPEKFKPIQAKLDDEKMSVSQAYTQVIAESGKDGRDGSGLPLPKKLAPAFLSRDGLFKKAAALARDLAKTVDDICNSPGGERLALLAKDGGSLVAKTGEKDGQPVTRYSFPPLADLLKWLLETCPFGQCPVCFEKANEPGKYDKRCVCCGGSGHVGETAWGTLTKSLDGGLAALQAYWRAEAEKAIVA